jgi:hypothetical protein
MIETRKGVVKFREARTVDGPPQLVQPPAVANLHGAEAHGGAAGVVQQLERVRAR